MTNPARQAAERIVPHQNMMPHVKELIDHAESVIQEAIDAATADITRERDEANNLCPDHRDKQQGKPCLACEIDRLTRDNRELRDVLRELNERLRAAWDARQLPADVIPGSLVTRCNKALG